MAEVEITQTDKHTCPRRVENGMASADSPFVGSGSNLDTWVTRSNLEAPGLINTGMPACSYCGSLSSDFFMSKIKEGWVVGPTDKSYKCMPPGTMVTVVVEPGKSGGNGGCGNQPAVWEERPIETLRVGDRVVTYQRANHQFMKNGRAILAVGHRSHSGELVTVKAGGRLSRYTPEHLCIARIGEAFADRFCVYLMRRGSSFRAGRSRGYYASQANFGPVARAFKEKADALWILSVHDSATEAAAAEIKASWLYGIPTVTFTASHESTAALTQSALDDLWLSIGDLAENAGAALVAHGRDVRFPLWESSPTGSGVLGGPGRSRLPLRRSAVVRACNLMSGMGFFPLNVERKMETMPIEVGREQYRGAVYSLAVDVEETFVADGLVTHNCYLKAPDVGSSQGKFYYQHLSVEQRKEFIQLYNDKAMVVGEPGHFYSMPFFCAR